MEEESKSLKSNYLLEDLHNSYYKNALDKEINSMPDNHIPSWPPSIELHPIIIKYMNKKILKVEDINDSKWLDLLFDNFDPVNIALSLGSGSGKHESYISNKGFVKKWDSIDLSNTTVSKLENSRISINSAINDLNFVDLPEKQYPLVFCHGVLHHIVNLENLLFQLNNTLTDNGLLVISEYVGEDKWQWDDIKIKEINSKIEPYFGSKYPEFQIKKPPIWVHAERPLESIRSSKIPEIVDYYFGSSKQYEHIFGSAIYPVVHSITGKFRQELIDNEDALNEILNFTIELDNDLTNDVRLKPTIMKGIYRKSPDKKQLLVRPWNRKQIKENLHHSLPLKISLKRKLKKLFT